MMKNCWIKSMVVVAVMFAFSIASATGVEAGKIKTFVSIVPQKYFVKKIGGNQVDVSVMVLPGNSPATYEPKPKQMVALSSAQIYFTIGVPFEKMWLKKIAATNTRMHIVHTEAGIEKEPMNGERPNGIKDPHVWLSPPLVMVQAHHIFSALLKADPDNSSLYIANYKKFIMEIIDIDIELQRIFLGKEGAKFMVFHPAWGYFARTYGLRMVSIESEGKAPKPATLQHLIGKAKEQGIGVIFVQPQFSTKSAEIIAKEIGGQVAFADPLALDWTKNLKEVAAKFNAALK